MTYNQPPSSIPMDPDIPSTPSQEFYGTNSNTVSSAGIPNDPSGSSSIVGAAAIAGAVAGLVIAGPVLGIVGAIGAGALASQKNKAGDVARASGDVVISAGERAKKIDEKHHVVDKTKKASMNFMHKAKDFENKHHIGEKAGKSMTDGFKFVSKKLKPKDKDQSW